MQIAVTIAYVPVGPVMRIPDVHGQPPGQEQTAGSCSYPHREIPGVERAVGSLQLRVRTGTLVECAHVYGSAEGPAAVDRGAYPALYLDVFQETAQGRKIYPENFL